MLTYLPDTSISNVQRWRFSFCSLKFQRCKEDSTSELTQRESVCVLILPNVNNLCAAPSFSYSGARNEPVKNCKVNLSHTSTHALSRNVRRTFIWYAVCTSIMFDKFPLAEFFLLVFLTRPSPAAPLPQLPARSQTPLDFNWSLLRDYLRSSTCARPIKPHHSYSLTPFFSQVQLKHTFTLFLSIFCVFFSFVLPPEMASFPFSLHPYMFKLPRVHYLIQFI